MTNKDFYIAYLYWMKIYKFKDSDQRVRSYLSSDIDSKKFSWLQSAREALLISTNQVSQRLGISTSSYCKFEKNEASGKISLEKMAEIAEAMDCEFVYAIRPKQRIPYSHVIWRQLLKDCLNHWWVRTRPEKKKPQALAWIARLKYDTPKYREEQGWARRQIKPKARIFSKADLEPVQFDWPSEQPQTNNRSDD